MALSNKEFYPTCPFDYRYGSEEMRELFRRNNMLRRFIDVEIALMKALEEVGIVPKGCHEVLSRCALRVSVKDIDKLESKYGHDIASLAIALAEACGECGKYVHLGATSYDVVDTAWSLIVRDALKIVKEKLKNVLDTLIKLSIEHKDTLMIGRTHGQHALPITLGFKLANYVYELSRSYERICDLEDRLIRGKISGAVGTMAAWGDKGPKIEELVLKMLNLRAHAITTQVAPRDGFAELVSALAILASQLDRLALEVRELSRNEINELIIASGKIGSSTMPHKSNPTIAERISGLAKVSRSLITVALENIPLMHERDLTNSSSERFLIPHIFLVIDQMLIDTERMLRSLRVNKEAMLRNLNLSKGAIMTECLMIKLVIKAGIPRHKAHSILSKLSREALSRDVSLRDVINESDVARLLSRDDINECFDYSKYLGSYEYLIERALNYAKNALRRC